MPHCWSRRPAQPLDARCTWSPSTATAVARARHTTSPCPEKLFDSRTTDDVRERLQRTPYDATTQQELITLHRTFQEKRQLDRTMSYIGIPFDVIGLACITAALVRSNSDIIPGDGTPEYICGFASLVPALVFTAPNWGTGRAYQTLRIELEEANVPYARVAPAWRPYPSPTLNGGVHGGVAMRF
jgi:hypothetical protein